MDYRIPVEKVKPGVKLKCDGGFLVDEGADGKPCGCLQEGQIVEVKDENGFLYVECLNGHHYLDGQLDDNDTVYVGFVLA